MRWAVVAILLLAGCASSPAPALMAPDPTTPIYGGADPADLFMFGPQTNGTADGRVLVAQCADRDNVWAYQFEATPEENATGSVVLTAPLDTPNATAWLIGGFVPSAGGLIASTVWHGGTGASIDPWHASFTVAWVEKMPRSFTVPVDAEGMVRVVIACRGEDPVNFVIGRDAPRAPDYLTPVVSTGFDVFLAAGSDDLAIYIPPTATAFPPVWSLAGQVRTEYDQAPTPTLRVGSTAIEWTGGPGWTETACSHDGWADDGEWRYTGNLHDGEQSEGGIVASHIATLGLSQSLIGPIEVYHTGDGGEPASFRFEVEHTASVDFQWFTMCQGVHIGATLETLFGTPGASAFVVPRGLA